MTDLHVPPAPNVSKAALLIAVADVIVGVCEATDADVELAHDWIKAVMMIHESQHKDCPGMALNVTMTCSQNLDRLCLTFQCN